MRGRLVVVTMVLMLAALACNLPGNGGSPARPTVTNQAPNVAPTKPAVKPSVTADPGPTPSKEAFATATETPAGLVELNYKGLRFKYPGDLFTNLDARIVPAETGEIGLAGWPGSAPESIEVKVNGYPLKDPFHDPRLTLYPIQTYAKVNSASGDIADRLEGLMVQGNIEPKNLPFLPMFNAGQVLATRVEKFSFQNGNGIRFLTCYSQAVLPIDKDCLFYTFQGLTSDRQYYLSVIFPVSLPALETPEMTKVFEDATLNFDDVKFEAYMKQVKDMINGAAPSDFTPNLTTLDQVVASVLAEPDVELKGPDLGAGTCPKAMTQRLQPDMRARVTFTDGKPLRVRQEAGKGAAVLGQMAEGATFVVSGGPECVGDGLWWKVKIDDGGLEGWVLEGEGGTYYVEPWK
jgi:hypothetical protein